ncbi:small acid-soluble spore protein Tlp [Paenisporosarcina sp. TG-14]|uniref:small acid-soluble spore protein Tlp n=1 Tax=Paenisporosarcina sp. TG-14 TaxID=1231057 RepID=UPI00031046C1|nr:small acid-soluble spore protein Tlp [Paenisporosarcina sp. TG-14]
MSWNTPKPDDRSDNAEKLKEMKKNTVDNMEAAEEAMHFADGKELEDIKQKNARRKESIEGFQKEIEDEIVHQKGYTQN